MPKQNDGGGFGERRCTFDECHVGRVGQVVLDFRDRHPGDLIGFVVRVKTHIFAEGCPPVLNNLGLVHGPIRLGRKWAPKDRNESGLFIAFAYSRAEYMLARIDLAFGYRPVLANGPMDDQHLLLSVAVPQHDYSCCTNNVVSSHD